MTSSPRLLTRFGDRFYAFDKPAGMAVHGNAEGIPDLVAWIRTQRSLPRDLKPGHRLDRATSGVVLCGAGTRARAEIAAWLPGSTKRYLALVQGAMEGSGRIERPLKDARRGRPLEAFTEWSVREALPGATLLELRLVTGRKHQLRRHLAAVGHPVVGDARYGRPAERLWLHAWRLELPERAIEAPLPAELLQDLERRRSGAASQREPAAD